MAEVRTNQLFVTDVAPRVAQVAALVAEAKGQYPAAVGRAFAALGSNPRVLEAYNTLYALSQVHPHRTIAFHGFEAHEVRAMDAAMVAPPDGQVSPVLNGEDGHKPSSGNNKCAI